MGAIVSQITSLAIVYSLHKSLVTQKMFPFDNVIMIDDMTTTKQSINKSCAILTRYIVTLLLNINSDRRVGWNY